MPFELTQIQLEANKSHEAEYWQSVQAAVGWAGKALNIVLHRSKDKYCFVIENVNTLKVQSIARWRFQLVAPELETQAIKITL